MQNPIIFACFQPILTFFPPDLLMKYRIFISTVDISENLKNIDIDIDNSKKYWHHIDKRIWQNIDIDIEKAIMKNIAIDKETLENIDIDKILNRLEFGISNRAIEAPWLDFPKVLKNISFQVMWLVGECSGERQMGV